MAKSKTEPDLINYISFEDIEIIKERVPQDFRSRLRDVFTHYTSDGVRFLGSVTRRGRRDIKLCSILPYRTSLRQFLVKGQSALEFGTSARGQWTPWAVRRFLLYDVFLHELGHLQIIMPKNSNNNRKFASETLAQKFADDLRRELWKNHFDHPDPVHNIPQTDELATISLWQNLDKKQRFKFVEIVLNAPHEKIPDLSEFGEINDEQNCFLNRALCF